MGKAMEFDPRELRHISLKWKLLIPFLFLPAALTVLLVGWGIRSQHQILAGQEERRMLNNYHDFRQRIEARLNFVHTIAEIVATNPDAQAALAAHDREALTRLYQPLYHGLAERAGVLQFHFHLYPGISFLRLHMPDKSGDELTGYRRSIILAYQTGRPTTGLEFGAAGFGLRAVSPIFYQDKLVGSVEIGANVGRDFLKEPAGQWQSDLSCYAPSPDANQTFVLLGTTAPGRVLLTDAEYHRALETGQPSFHTVRLNRSDLAVVVGPVLDFQDRGAMVVEITRDRSGTLSLIRRHTILLVVFGLALLAVALVFVLWVSALFLAPIWTLVDQAKKITDGQRVPQLEITTRDEFGTLAAALNAMLTSLEDSRIRLRNHAFELESRVRLRTAELIQSEEKFRTLVERIPLAVYRLEQDMIRTFISPHIEALTGWPPEDLVGPPAVWGATIHPEDRPEVMKAKREALDKGLVFEMEYRLMDINGQEVHVYDHAVPFRAESGEVRHLDGYLLDIRERKRLQDQTLKAEELKTLSEISARLAHEFRNPLSVVGLCARRLEKAAEMEGLSAKYASIITDEVARLEQILKMILSYIRPMDLTAQLVEAEDFFKGIQAEAQRFCREHDVEIELKLGDDLPGLYVDRERLSRAFLNLLHNAAYQMPSRGVLQLSVLADEQEVEVRLLYPAGYLSDDRLRHFFYPFTTEEADTDLVDLPLVPVCVHRHGGLIHVGRFGEDLVEVTVRLPAADAPRSAAGEQI